MQQVVLIFMGISVLFCQIYSILFRPKSPNIGSVQNVWLMVNLMLTHSGCRTRMKAIFLEQLVV